MVDSRLRGNDNQDIKKAPVISRGLNYAYFTVYYVLSINLIRVYTS
jgi:hypothetical protein